MVLNLAKKDLMPDETYTVQNLREVSIQLERCLKSDRELEGMHLLSVYKKIFLLRRASEFFFSKPTVYNAFLRFACF